MRDRVGRQDGSSATPGSGDDRDALGPGKQTLISATFAPVQLRVGAGPAPLQAGDAPVQAAAVGGIAGPSGALPYADVIQHLFGRHDVSGVKAHIGGPAAEASQAMGAEAYATGDHVAFARAPSLHTAAHEAAHVVQQRGGVQLKGGVGAAGDRHEQHADQVADHVVRGESAEGLLDAYAPRGASGSGGGPAAAFQRQAAREVPAGPQSTAAPVGPATTAPASSTNPGAGQLAQLLAAPRAAGLSDPVVDHLLSLPIPTMLDEIADAVECGHAIQLEARVAAAPPILMAAVQATELARTRPLTASHLVLQRAGAALDRVSLDQQEQILSWMLARGGVSIRATTLVEGMMAMRAAGVRPGEDQAGNDGAEGGDGEGDEEREHTYGEDMENAVAAVQSAKAGMPPPIKPYKWGAPIGDRIAAILDGHASSFVHG